MSRSHLLIPLAACVIVSGLITTTGAQPKGEKPGHSSFYRDFDSKVAAGICLHLAPKAGGGSRPHGKVPPPERHEFKIFDVTGDISPDQLKKVLGGLKEHFAKLVRENKAVTATDPKDTIADRPMYLLQMNMLAPGTWVQPDTMRGFYFTYKQGKVEGAVDVVAVRVGPGPGSDKVEWTVVGAVHEPAP
jgi:hypothetical protein